MTPLNHYISMPFLIQFSHSQYTQLRNQITMAGIKFSMALFLLLSGMVLFGELQQSMGARVCPQYCLNVDYMTCNSSGDQRLSPKCNCCMARKDCTLHLSNGAEISCS